MSARAGLGIGVVLAVLATLLVILLTFERPPVSVVQRGFRGTAMELVYNPRALGDLAALQGVPEVLEAADTEGPRASEIFENVQVLGNVSAAQFGRIMIAMTEWVSPEDRVPGGGCNYCHNPENFADDNVYTKVVSRRMLQMTRAINAEHADHVAQTGVTCWTCHRGNPVPAQVWSTVPMERGPGGMMADPAGQNLAAPASGLASLPLDPFTPFLLEDNPIRLAGTTALPTGNRQSIKQAEWTYGLMMHFSQATGANCTNCHNSRNFSSWEESSPQRVSAWHGIRMTRDINANYIEPLRPVFPPHRLGPVGDTLKANCGTCHQGVNKPLLGYPMRADYPELDLVTLGPTEIRR